VLNHKIKNITIFFSYGVSIKTWAKTGLLQREVKLYQELIKRYGVQVQFLTYGDATDKKWEAALNGISLLPVYERFRRPSNKILSFIQTLFIPWIFRHELRQADLIKTNQVWGGWVAVIVKWIFRKPLIVRCGYEYYDFCRKQGRSRAHLFLVFWLSKFVYINGNHIHVATYSDKVFIQNEFKVLPSKVNVRPNWIDSNTFTPLSLSLCNRILFVGQLNIQKNLSLLLRSLETTTIGLDVVGEGELGEKLYKIAHELKVDAKFLESITNDKMPEVYNRYPIYVLCSKYEGNPKTILEAMSCGLAVIGTDVPGIRDIISDGENGLLVPEDSSALRKAIQNLFADESLRHKLGANARKTILKNNSMEHATSNEYAVYQQIAK